mmetsp:Transcript_20859/g.46596  ORF Transcript_20859/g.46596 Transcript_20859/m.46596 type:complete len:85 (+) Transcript_20859:412-666(+)
MSSSSMDGNVTVAIQGDLRGIIHGLKSLAMIAQHPDHPGCVPTPFTVSEGPEYSRRALLLPADNLEAQAISVCMRCTCRRCMFL